MQTDGGDLSKPLSLILDRAPIHMGEHRRQCAGGQVGKALGPRFAYA
jgi:hypothetical protein